MIYSVRGRLAAVEPNLAVVECAGVGYAVRTSSVTVSRLPAIGEEAMLYTYLHISENAAELFGFRDQNELSCFKMLISVTRVGPKAALSVLSSVTPERFALCVASGDAKTISKAPGIGLKTAQRIILELKDKMSKEAAASGSGGFLQRRGGHRGIGGAGLCPKRGGGRHYKAGPCHVCGRYDQSRAAGPGYAVRGQE